MLVTPMSIRLAAMAALLAVAVLTHAAQAVGAVAEALPPHEPPVKNAEAVVALGRMLFFDTNLSADGQVSCATCHQSDRALSDGLATASGVARRQGSRNTPSLLDVAEQRSLFWDGRRASLEAQVLDPLLNPIEHGLRDEAELLDKVRANPRYEPLLASAYGIAASQLTTAHVAAAVAAYEKTLVSGPTPFDEFLAGQSEAMSAAARRGWVVFDQQAACTRCHVVAGARPLLTDHQFHSLAVGFQKVERKLPQLTQRLAALGKDSQALSREVVADPDIAELGRFVFTLDPQDLGAFKTPGLRNVAVTAPYMHDGSVPTLGDAVDLEVYYRGARADRPLILTPAEREDLIAFLLALTSSGTTPSSAMPTRALPPQP